MRPGRLGATDEIGLMAMEYAHPIRDLHARILTALGFDQEALAYHVNGRLERLTGVANLARVIPGVLA